MARDLDFIFSILKDLVASPEGLSIDYLTKTYQLCLEDLDLILESFATLDKNLVTYTNNKLQLLKSVDLLDDSFLHHFTNSKGRVLLLNYIDSTNTIMLNKAKSIAKGDVIIAEVQSSGRGRRDRVWQGGFANQLTFSLGWNFTKLDSTLGLSVAVGSIIAKTISDLGFSNVQIKWPNDLYIHGKKFGGILIENIKRYHDYLTVIGIGLNIYTINTYLSTVTSLFANLKEANQQNLNRNKIAVNLINHLRKYLTIFDEQGFSAFYQEANQRSFLNDHQIEIQVGNQLINGLVKGVNDKGELLIKDSNGALQVLNSGHITKVSI